MRLLVIEDEPRIAEILKNGLTRAGFVVDLVRLLADAREALALTAYDAAILDLGLPDGDGLKLLEELRPAPNRIPILVLTARDAVQDRVSGLDAGADAHRRSGGRTPVRDHGGTRRGRPVRLHRARLPQERAARERHRARAGRHGVIWISYLGLSLCSWTFAGS